MRPLAVERYRRLGAQTYGDGAAGWYLAGLVDAKAAMWDDLEHVAREDDNGRPGWAVAADPATCRRSFLPWAAQLYGMSVPVEDVAPGVPETVVNAHRQRVIDRPAAAYGTTASIVAAALSVMTGPRVHPVERRDPATSPDDAPWNLTLVVHPGDVPDEAALQQAVDRAKPAWVIVHIVLTAVRTLRDVNDEYASLADVNSGNVSLADVLTP
jgi:hypothetical protein